MRGSLRCRSEWAAQLHPGALEQPHIGIFEKVLERSRRALVAESKNRLQVVQDLLVDIVGEVDRKHRASGHL
jgi:hypothetical protein